MVFESELKKRDEHDFFFFVKQFIIVEKYFYNLFFNFKKNEMM